METKHIQTKTELNQRIEDFNYIEDLCVFGGSRISSNEAYAHDDGSFGLFPERWVAEILDFAEKFPPADIAEFDYQNLADQPYHFQQYGLRIDNLNQTLYLAFLAYFADWYVANRHTLKLQHDPSDTYSCDGWEAVDKLMMSNSRLKVYVGVPRPKQVVKPEPAPPVVSEPVLTAEQSAAKTLAEIREKKLNFYGI